ncbi:MAG: alkaline phosphatase family protein [Phycisphaerae bacterium]|nr:alkaline phosphatase family protein [Phycisphaerae bacterium]
MFARTAVLNIVGLTPGVFARNRAPKLRDFARQCGGVRNMTPPLPAVTCSSQSSMLTGLPPSGHGIVGNGWFDRDYQDVVFWKQSNHLVQGSKVWDRLRALASDRGVPFTVANSFWWFNMYSSADYSVTPRPQYRADGRKVPDCYTQPPELRDDLQRTLGQFPLFNFWGPMSGIQSTDWIAAAAMEIERRHSPTLHLIYLPHLDYCLQQYGPSDTRIDAEVREMDRVFDHLHRSLAERGVRLMVVSEYGITEVDDAVWLNRALRDAGLLRVRTEDGREHLDAGASSAFAVADHQVAHVYVRDPAQVPQVQALLERTAGVERALSGDARREAGLDHGRAGDVVCVAQARRWFAYGWWHDDRCAPDYARTVDIHRKPGYDPLELLWDPTRPSRATAAGMLALRKAGFRTLLQTVPLDTRLIRGSHGRIEASPADQPVLIADQVLLPDRELFCTDVHDVIVRSVAGANSQAAQRSPLR